MVVLDVGPIIGFLVAEEIVRILMISDVFFPRVNGASTSIDIGCSSFETTRKSRLCNLWQLAIFVIRRVISVEGAGAVELPVFVEIAARA